MSTQLALLGTAFTLGFVHTLLGPDHYVPFVAMARAGKWTLRKTIVITLLCGFGHVLSSVLLGLIGIGAGVLLVKLEAIESVRGGIAGWLLLGFGLAYFVAGLVKAARNMPHAHWHSHGDGTLHEHPHDHAGDHLHAHETSAAPQPGPGSKSSGASMTPWILFTIFLFGPCEPLIPMLMYPAANSDPFSVISVTLVFTLATMLAMTGMVVALTRGLGVLKWNGLERYSHAAAGLAVVGCGVAVVFGL